MLVLQSTSVDPSDDGLGRALGNIQEMAKQIICFSEDMEYVPDNSDLMRLPETLLPSPLTLNLLLHNDENMQEAIYRLADQKGFVINLNEIYLGPQIMWIQRGGILTPADRLSLFVILRQPKSKVADPETIHSIPEPEFRGSIRIPVGQGLGQYVQSNFECQVGDVIILEGGERLLFEPYNVCVLATLYKIERKHNSNFQK